MIDFKYFVSSLTSKQQYELFLKAIISICNSMGSSEIWDEYHECRIKNGKNFTRRSGMKLPITNTTGVVFIPNFHCYPCYSMLIPDMSLKYENLLCCYVQIVLHINMLKTNWRYNSTNEIPSTTFSLER